MLLLLALAFQLPRRQLVDPGDGGGGSVCSLPASCDASCDARRRNVCVAPLCDEGCNHLCDETIECPSPPPTPPPHPPGTIFAAFTSGASCETNGAGPITTLAQCSGAGITLGLSITSAVDDGVAGGGEYPDEIGWTLPACAASAT